MVYFILDRELNNIKIGHSDSPYRRLRQLQSGHSKNVFYSIELILPGGQKFENDLHVRFKDLKKNGEWFTYNSIFERFISEEKKEEIKSCLVCGEEFLTSPEKDDVTQHSNFHIKLRKGAYPYKTREILKKIAWQYLGDKDKPVAISSFIDKQEDAKRLIAFSWWMSEKQKNPEIPDYYFDDYVLDRIEYLDAKESCDNEKMRVVKEKINQHWKTGKYQTYN